MKSWRFVLDPMLRMLRQQSISARTEVLKAGDAVRQRSEAVEEFRDKRAALEQEHRELFAPSVAIDVRHSLALRRYAGRLDAEHAQAREQLEAAQREQDQAILDYREQCRRVELLERYRNRKRAEFLASQGKIEAKELEDRVLAVTMGGAYGDHA